MYVFTTFIYWYCIYWYLDNITQYVYVNNIYWQTQQNRGLVKSNDFLNPSDIQGRS